MKYFYILEIIIRIILTVLIFIHPGYKGVLLFLKKLGNKIQILFGIVSQMTPDDFLKEHHQEKVGSERAAQDIYPVEETISDTNNEDKNGSAGELGVLSQETVLGFILGDNALDSKTAEKIQSLKYEAQMFKDKEKFEDAEKKLIEAITILPHDYDIQKLLSEIYFEQGQFVKTSTLLKKLLLQDPNNHKFLWQLGYIHMTQGDGSTAKLLFEKALEQKKDNPKYYISLIDIHTQSLSREQAIPLMEKLQKLRPSNIDYLLSLASLYEETNNIDKAVYRYTKIIELDPHHSIAKQKLS